MNTTFLEAAKKTPSKKLPDKIISDFSQRGYNEIKDTKLHVDNASTRATDSIAYTYGNDIFVQNTYANNEDVLSHEAGHVIQQMRVGVSPSTASSIINNDAALENQANDIAFGDLELTSGGSSAKAVQRLMSLDEFKSKTSRFMGKRNEIKTIDLQLETYNNFVDGIKPLSYDIAKNPYFVFFRMKNMIEALNNACINYKGKRNITELKNQVQKEKDAINFVINIADQSQKLVPEKIYRTETPEETQKHPGISQAQLIRARFFATQFREKAFNRYPDIEFYKELNNGFNSYLIDNNISNLVNIEGYTNSYQSLFRSAVDDPDAPDALKNVLNEALEFAPNIPVSVQGGKFANKYKQGTENKPQYDMSLTISGEDTVISSGSYLHELTHINVGESYGNTSLFLGLCTDDDYKELFKERVDSIRKLTKAAQDELVLAEKGQSPFTVNHLKNDLLWKLSYAAGDTLHDDFKRDFNKLYTKYIDDAVKRNNNPNSVKEGISEETGNTIKLKIRDAMESETGIKEADDLFGVNSNVFVEYDAVINQLLLWCYGWGIPKDNNVVKVLCELVEKEYQRRTAARNKRGVNLNNINSPKSK